MTTEFLNCIALTKRLYDQILEPVCDQYDITRMELDILLFLHNHPGYDTATDIIKKRWLTKSHVSSSIKQLEEQHYLERFYQDGNGKTIHLKVTDHAAKILKSGLAAQKEFYGILFSGFNEEQVAAMETNLKKLTDNVQTALTGGNRHDL